jgi:hypothetical protein
MDLCGCIVKEEICGRRVSLNSGPLHVSFEKLLRMIYICNEITLSMNFFSVSYSVASFKILLFLNRSLHAKATKAKKASEDKTKARKATKDERGGS